MILIEGLVVFSITILALGYFSYKKYLDIFKSLKALLSFEVLVTVSIILLAYFSLKFLFALGS